MIPSFGIPLLLKPRHTLHNGLVAYWNLNSNSNAQFGGVNGTDTNFNFSSSGKIGNCGGSTGSGYTSFGTTSTLAMNGAMSISLWANMPNFSNYRFLASRLLSSGVTYSNFELRVNPSSQVQWLGAGGIGPTVTSPTLSTSTWYHIVAVRDPFNGSTYPVRVYINGSLGTTSGSNSHSIADNASSVAYLGTRNDLFTTLPSGGLIDEVGIWNRAITTDEISYLYNSGNARAYPF